jgi:DNA modification methylase
MARNPSSHRLHPHKLGAGHSQLSIVYRSIKDLRLDPKNPRLHSKRQIEQIASSIRTFGFNVPILIDEQGRVIAGHGRVLAALLLGLSHVPTVTIDHLSETQRRAFVLADNKLAETSTWNAHLLAEQLKALSEVELDFSLEATGFEMGEIDVMIEGLAPAHDGEEDPADALPEADLQVTHSGDLWQLGNHRVLCGDALKEESYQGLMAGHLARAVFTDPPYNDPVDGYVTGFGKIHHAEFAMASGEMSEAEFTEFLFAVFSHLARNSEKGSLHYACIDWRHTGEMLAAARRAYTEFKALCIWVKEAGGQGSLYRSQHELVFVFKSGKGKHRNNVQLGQYGRYRTNIWQYPRVSSFARPTEEGNLSALHPTVKPVALVADAIMDCTARGDIVLDPFLGSGTTVIAAERVGRTCYGMEIEPGYVDTIVRRWQTFTGKDAVLVASGGSFNKIEKELKDEQGE